jgi:hypothetical protein
MWSLAYAVIQKELELFVENAQEDGPHVHGPPEIKVHVVIRASPYDQVCWVGFEFAAFMPRLIFRVMIVYNFLYSLDRVLVFKYLTGTFALTAS